MGFEVKGHFLYKDGRQVTYQPTPNTGRLRRPRFLVLHFTGGSYAGAVNWLTQRRAKASAHLVVSEDGEVTQLAPFNKATWHAGKSFWAGISGLNSWSIGIEMANLGPVDRGKVPANLYVEAAHRNGGGARGWQSFPEAQVEAVQEIGHALAAAYGIEAVVGHDDIAPGRKIDPGPAFPMARVRRAIMGSDGQMTRLLGDDRSGSGASRAVYGAGAAGVGGLGFVADTFAQVQGALSEADGYISAGTWIGLAIGLVVIAAAAWSIYHQLDEAGALPWSDGDA